MRILYGVQATGNGHITRARVIAPLLKQANAEVTYLFTGRDCSRLFEMEVFGEYMWREGLTFTTKFGRVQYIKTLLDNDLVAYSNDLRGLDLSHYDVVISDFEPVTAWAARSRKVRTVGVGHQYAFGYAIPKTGADVLARLVMRYFAPVDVGVGLHWHHFNQSILPPIIETPPPPEKVVRNKIVVYLPFEELSLVVRMLRHYPDFQFYVYSGSVTHEEADNVRVIPLARAQFQEDVRDCSGVICNAGFELASESLQLGKKLLVKPLRAQMEQLSNAMALDILRLGTVMPRLEHAVIEKWLYDGKAIKVVYPYVGKFFVDWLLSGDWRVDLDWVRAIWDQVAYQPVEDPMPSLDDDAMAWVT